MIRAWILPLVAALGLAGCVSTNTFFPEPLREDLTYNWRVVDIQVNVPRTLTTTDANSQMPDVDIIWREDGPGDVYAQVQSVMEDALQQASLRFNPPIKGTRRVILQTEQIQFHSLTERARSNIGGIHNIDFLLTVVDADTGEVLAGPALFESDVKAYGGAKAAALVARGQTMRVRIIQRVSDVVATYLGIAGNRAVSQGSHVDIGR